MTHSDLYQAYTDALKKLNQLQSEYRDVSVETGVETKREALLEQIKSCQQKLLSVTDQLIYCNPFQKGARTKHGTLVEMLS